MEGLSLRLFRETDIPALHAACWPELSPVEVQERIIRFNRHYNGGRAWGLVALRGEQIVGFGQLVHWGTCYEICDLVVGEKWREQGIGTALICALLKIAHAQGALEAEIGGAISNPRALALYRRLGFHDRREVMMDLGKGLEPVLYLSLALKETGNR
jgi:ribosomal protein S18 acetylase RimI-like enzyme